MLISSVVVTREFQMTCSVTGSSFKDGKPCAARDFKICYVTTAWRI